MPSEQYAPVLDQPYHQDTGIQQQAKVCISCHVTLLDPGLALQDPQQCTLCREKPQPPLVPPPDLRQLRIDQDTPYALRQAAHESQNLPSIRRSQESHPSAFETAPSEPAHPYRSPALAYARKPISLNIPCNTTPAPAVVPRHHQAHFPTAAVPTSYESSTVRQHTSALAYCPDPFADITRLRVRPRAHHCLYAGATFEGTQKSGRNSYDVNVTIVDVDLAASTLCGYLRIRGLTDDWPELTTYFDAEIIGNRYGFLTQNWGATQHEDIVHWSRFPAFKHIKNEAKRPHMTIDDQDRGVVFMRWKERFLVPDHRVHDINGASFAGFYYVCIDLNPPATTSSPTQTRSASQPAPMTIDCMDDIPGFSPRKTGGRRSRRDSSVRRRGPFLAPVAPPVATMSGFYYHQNSEPYQQLSLAHVPEDTSSSFEFR
ncbi:unnamed protein product [Cyclocybe aegerita]|uniref:Vacuolar import and degradation protein-domain-containing protein n=1 Tax=Cyclocybe aegerita TaxID=1973307 RepID=A0A8S0Y102_CYCAE|nr:unnamed protein product [Cyclocybe aegerita]